MKPAIATVCSLEASLGTVLDDYMAGHVDAVDVWLGHAETFLETHTPAELRELLAMAGITPVAASFQGGLLTSQGEARREHWRHFDERLGLCRDLGIPVLVIECKNANKDEAIALGVDQISRYHRETPELFVSQQLFTATDAIGFSYGVSWNTVRRNLFNWKHEEVGKLEAKVKSFCAIPQVLAFLKDYILFAEKDEELNKYILRQHQTGAVEATPSPALSIPHVPGGLCGTLRAAARPSP